VTAWQFDGGSHQQWNVSSNGGEYVFKNVGYGTYITFGPYVLFGSPTAAFWFVQEYKGGFLIASSTDTNFSFKLGGLYADATPVLIYPIHVGVGPDSQVWYFNSITTTATSPSGGSTTSCTPATIVHSPSTGVIAGSVVAAVVVVFLFVTLAFCIGKRRGSAAVNNTSESPPQPALEGPSALTPFILNNQGTDVRPPQHLTNRGLPAPSSSILSTTNPDIATGPSSLVSPQPMYHQSYQSSMSPAPQYAPYDPAALS